jgi:heme-degrading monooxygenase HmoA
MYVVVRRYTGASALVDVMIQREQEVRDLISTVPGFRAYYAARTGEGGAVATITICDTKQGTDESSRRAADWVRSNMSGAPISPPEITEGETYINF